MTTSRSVRHASTWGCALDIDGVMLRGGVPVAGAAETVKQLQQDGIPHVFLTNGSGSTEQQKADSLSRILGLEGEDQIPAANMQLASTPMQVSDGSVMLVTGKREIV